MKGLLFSVLMSIFVSVPSFAAEMSVSVSKEDLSKMAKEYHFSQLMKTSEFKPVSFQSKGVQPQGPGRRCGEEDDYNRPGPSGKCVDFACEKLGTYGCDSQSEISEVATLCSSQFNESCMANSCRKLGTYGCDSLSELKEVAGLCENVRSYGCVDQICGRLGTYGCDSISEISGVAKACSGIRDTGCIASLCERLGTYGCDSLSEIEAVAKTCKGR